MRPAARFIALPTQALAVVAPTLADPQEEAERYLMVRHPLLPRLTGVEALLTYLRAPADHPARVALEEVQLPYCELLGDASVKVLVGWIGAFEAQVQAAVHEIVPPRPQTPRQRGLYVVLSGLNALQYLVAGLRESEVPRDWKPGVSVLLDALTGLRAELVGRLDVLLRFDPSVRGFGMWAVSEHAVSRWLTRFEGAPERGLDTHPQRREVMGRLAHLAGEAMLLEAHPDRGDVYVHPELPLAHLVVGGTAERPVLATVYRRCDGREA